MDLELMINSFPKLLNATIVHLNYYLCHYCLDYL